MQTLARIQHKIFAHASLGVLRMDLGVTGLSFPFRLHPVTKFAKKKLHPFLAGLYTQLPFNSPSPLDPAHSTSRANEDKVAVPIQLKKMARLISPASLLPMEVTTLAPCQPKKENSLRSPQQLPVFRSIHISPCFISFRFLRVRSGRRRQALLETEFMTSFTKKSINDMKLACRLVRKRPPLPPVSVRVCRS